MAGKSLLAGVVTGDPTLFLLREKVEAGRCYQVRQDLKRSETDSKTVTMTYSAPYLLEIFEPAICRRR